MIPNQKPNTLKLLQVPNSMRLNFLCTLLFSTATLLTTSSTLLAQRVNFDQVVQPFDQIAEDFEEFLVQLAWLNNPSNDALTYKLNIADQEIRNARQGWWEAIGTQISYNPVTAEVDGKPIFPEFSYGATINLNSLIITPGKIRIAKENFKIAQTDIDQEKLRIRSETLQRYRKYQLALEILKVRTKMEEDANANFQFQSSLFTKTEASFEDYNAAYNAYHSAVEARLEAETEVEIAKIMIEEVIGIPLETAERFNIKE